MPERTFTLEEANGLLATVDRHVGRAQDATRRMRDVRDQLVDLRIVWGDRVDSPTCPDHEEYEGYRRAFSELESDLRATLDAVHSLGCVIKDVEQGLVDFPVQRGDGVVYLCWRRGEEGIRFWHSQDAGFAGRQSVDSL